MGPSDTTFELGVLEYLDLAVDRPRREKQDTAFSAALLAESIGYRRVWIPEHHSISSPSPDPLPILAALATRTSRVRLGTAVLLTRLRDPYLTAEALSVVSALCGTRLDVGLGRGGISGSAAHTLSSLLRDDEQADAATRTLISTLGLGCSFVAPLAHPYQVWLHGAGVRSAVLAAELDGHYCHGLFLNPDVDGCIRAFNTYRSLGGRGTTAVAIALAVNEDPSIALADAARQPFSVITGPPEVCVATVRNVQQVTGADEVVVAEVSSDAQRHHQALEEVFELVMKSAAHQGRSI